MTCVGTGKCLRNGASGPFGFSGIHSRWLGAAHNGIWKTSPPFRQNSEKAVTFSSLCMDGDGKA